MLLHIGVNFGKARLFLCICKICEPKMGSFLERSQCTTSLDLRYEMETFASFALSLLGSHTLQETL